MDLYVASHMLSNTLTRYSWARAKDIIKNRDKYICQYCGETCLDGDVDHILPISRGGSDSVHNLVWSCKSCNRSKGGKTLNEWNSVRLDSELEFLLRIYNVLIDFLNLDYDGYSPSCNTKKIKLEAAVSCLMVLDKKHKRSGIPKEMLDEYWMQFYKLIFTEYKGNDHNDLQLLRNAIAYATENNISILDALIIVLDIQEGDDIRANKAIDEYEQAQIELLTPGPLPSK